MDDFNHFRFCNLLLSTRCHCALLAYLLLTFVQGVSASVLQEYLDRLESRKSQVTPAVCRQHLPIPEQWLTFVEVQVLLSFFERLRESSGLNVLTAGVSCALTSLVYAYGFA